MRSWNRIGVSRTTRDCPFIGKVGQRWTADRRRYTDASPRQLTRDTEESLRRRSTEAISIPEPGQLTRDTEESLRRLRIPCFSQLLLHAVDPAVDVRRSAEALDTLRQRGLAESIGISNASPQDLVLFADSVPCTSLQCPLNLLQRQTLDPLIQTATTFGVNAYVYWVLMKGLLAGKISRGHQFPVGDSRPGYEIFQGAAREQAHDVVDRLREIAENLNTTVAKLVIG